MQDLKKIQHLFLVELNCSLVLCCVCCPCTVSPSSHSEWLLVGSSWVSVLPVALVSLER